MCAVWLAILMAITPIFVCGAECGIVSAGASGGVLHWNTVNGTVTADTGTFHAPGIRSYKFTTAAGASIYVAKNLASPTILVGRCYVNFSSLPSATCRIVEGVPAAGNDPEIEFDAATSKLFAAVAGTRTGSTGFSVTTGTWYRLDFRFDVSGTTRTSQLSVNGTDAGTAGSAATASTLNSVRIGINTFSTTANGTHFIDDIILSTTTADFPIGASGVVGLSPNQDGTHNFNLAGDFKYTNTTNVAVGATDTWTHVDAVPLTQITDFLAVVGAANTEYLEWRFAASPSDVATINGVEVVSSHHSASTTANKETMRLIDGASSSDVFTDTDFSQTTICYNSKQYATKPSTGAWTKTTLDAVKVRWNSSFGTVDESPVPFIDGVILEADYVAQATNPSATDTLTVSESTVPVATLSPTETVTLTEAWSTTLDARATDTLTVSESASASQGAGSQVGTGSDAASLSESAAIATVLTAADSFAASESPRIATGLTAADSATLSESARATLTLVLTDSAALTESWRAGLAVSVADGPSLSENASASQGAGSQVATASDTLTVTESVLANLAPSVTDSVALTESPLADLGGTASDGLTVSEFGQGVSGQQMNGQAMLTDITFTPRLQASETTIADVQGEESLT